MRRSDGSRRRRVGAVRELAAALLDHPGPGRAGVPETVLVELTHGEPLAYSCHPRGESLLQL